jgi:hypothetical protein
MSDLQDPKLTRVPDLEPVVQDLSHFETASALLHLETALGALSGLAGELEQGKRMDPMQQRATERALLIFQEQLRVAHVLTRQGLAYCRNWSDSLMPPADSYGSQGQERAKELDVHGVRLDG